MFYYSLKPHKCLIYYFFIVHLIGIVPWKRSINTLGMLQLFHHINIQLTMRLSNDIWQTFDFKCLQSRQWLLHQTVLDIGDASHFIKLRWSCAVYVERGKCARAAEKAQRNLYSKTKPLSFQRDKLSYCCALESQIDFLVFFIKCVASNHSLLFG